MAAITPEIVAAHGLSPDEYPRIRKILGRAPNYIELGHLLGDVVGALLVQVARAST